MSGGWRVWVLASRPKTLFAAVTPVVLGTALAFADSRADFFAALAALCGAVFIQIGTNFANDYWDAKKGADTGERLGPLRVTAAGLAKPGAVLAATGVAFGISALAGVYLILVAGWPVLAIGLVSIACGIAYTAGPFPLAYLGLGEVFSFVFFGPVAVAGTFFVQAGGVGWEAALAGFVPGAYSVALISLNNFRDRAQDVAARKWTLAARFGEKFARVEIVAFLALPSAVVLGLWAGFGTVSFAEALVVASVAGVGAVAIARSVYRLKEMRTVNSMLPRTGLISVVVCLLLSLFIVL
ncbi:MAG: 1,4-dihydroxy-2-naphthoate polyprenyltransferase [Verrucomicrobia bacterium]|nr:1,4-dihydroxy-2-naphthoate polyprenyltransferase [Verrucomicrobiota bacterium]